jgi:hypothetical protein
MKKSYRGQYAVSKEWQIDLSNAKFITAIKETVLNQALNEHPNTTESDWEIEYKIQDDYDKPITLINVECTMKSRISAAIPINPNKPSRNKLTPQQTRALTALWEKWRDDSNLKLQRIAYSPYGAPYISIERRDDAPELGKWDWCITAPSKYDGQGVHITWYSNSKEPLPAEIRNFLRKAWDKEFASINQTNL